MVAVRMEVLASGVPMALKCRRSVPMTREEGPGAFDPATAPEAS